MGVPKTTISKGARQRSFIILPILVYFRSVRPDHHAWRRNQYIWLYHLRRNGLQHIRVLIAELSHWRVCNCVYSKFWLPWSNIAQCPPPPCHRRIPCSHHRILHDVSCFCPSLVALHWTHILAVGNYQLHIEQRESSATT